MPLSIIVPSSSPVQEAALRFLYGGLPREQREAQVAETLAAAGRNELSLQNLLMALEGERIVGAVLAMVRPGGAGFLWPPVVRAGSGAGEISLALLESVARRVDGQGVVFTQCLLDPDDAGGRATLDRGGFPHATDLIVLSKSLQESLPESAARGLSAVCYTEALHGQFAKVAECTYAQTLDCPALARLRGGEESLESHRATGQFDPNAWRLYRLGDQEIGILLLAEHPDRDTWEVTYLGVVPEARGRGYGRAILDEGLALAKRSGRSAIEIGVDVANVPARRLYLGRGFEEVRRFGVHLRLRSLDAATSRSHA